MPSLVLHAENLVKRYGGVLALNGFSLSLHANEIHGLVGENGAGKSTFVKIITGVTQPDSGSIAIEGRKYSRLTPLQALKLGIQVVHQDLSLFPNLTVMENIASIGFPIQKWPVVNWKRIKYEAQRILDDLGACISVKEEVGRLSVGDRQIVAIARAILAKAKLLVLDEPTAALSHREIMRLFNILTRLKSNGISILIISHKLDEILNITDFVTVIRDGVKIGTYETKSLTREDLEFLMTGRHLAVDTVEIREAKGDVVLKVDGLSKKGLYSDVSFELHAGEVLGLIGPLGSGRTELALGIIGLIPPDSGKIYFRNKEVSFKSLKEAMDKGIIYCPEDRLTEGLFLHYSVATNIASPNYKALLNKWKLLTNKKVNLFAKKIIDTLDIKTKSAQDPVWTLSGGNQQKVMIGKMLAKNPAVLIVDKPTFGIDITTKAAIHQMLRDIAKKGTGVLLISDEAAEVLRCADRVLIMRDGKIVKEVTPGTIREKELYDLVFGEAEVGGDTKL